MYYIRATSFLQIWINLISTKRICRIYRIEIKSLYSKSSVYSEMAKKTNIKLIIFSTISNIIDYSTMVGWLISLTFLFIFIKGFFKQKSPLKTSFYFFTMLATLADLTSWASDYIDIYLLYPLLGQSKQKKIRNIYFRYIGKITAYIIEVSFNLDLCLDGVLTINRFTALVFPLHHKKARLL